MRRLVLIVDLDVTEDEAIGPDEYQAANWGEYAQAVGGFLANEVNNCVEMPGTVTAYTARWTEYDTHDADV
jgi:hypothetical protein